MEFLIFCMCASIIFGIISGMSKTSLFNKYNKSTNKETADNNYYIFFLDWHNK